MPWFQRKRRRGYGGHDNEALRLVLIAAGAVAAAVFVYWFFTVVTKSTPGS